jgi:hypothetical protein
MKINYYQDVIIMAGCSVIAIAVCRLIDTGSTMQQAADLIGISQTKACNMYQKCATRIAEAHNKIVSNIERIRADADAAAYEKSMLIREGKDAAAQNIIVPKIPIRSYTACDTDHFARARAIFPSLDWTQYCLVRLLHGLKVAPTREYMRKALGISSNMAGEKLDALVSIGAVLSCQKQPKPVQSAADLHRHQSYVYRCEIHEFFKDLTNGNIGQP